jgi:hypothetical protein
MRFLLFERFSKQLIRMRRFKLFLYFRQNFKLQNEMQIEKFLRKDENSQISGRTFRVECFFCLKQHWKAIESVEERKRFLFWIVLDFDAERCGTHWSNKRMQGDWWNWVDVSAEKSSSQKAVNGERLNRSRSFFSSFSQKSKSLRMTIESQALLLKKLKWRMKAPNDSDGIRVTLFQIGMCRNEATHWANWDPRKERNCHQGLWQETAANLLFFGNFLFKDNILFNSLI